MAEQEELKIIISADTIELIRSLEIGGKKLDEFGKDGTFSIQQLNTALRALKKEFDKVQDPIQRAKIGESANQLSRAIQFLNQNFREYTRVQEQSGRATSNTNNNLRGLEDGTRRARIAVYGLNQVVRDLPFGFIAISNNLPVLIDQFQELRQQEGSTRKALQAFSAGLIGASGVSIALSAVISLITTAVQKYGSLERAFDAILGVTNSLKIAKQDLNAEIIKVNANTTSEAEKIRFLVEALNNNALSQQQRISAYTELKKIAPGVIRDMTVENALTASGSELIRQRSLQLIQYIKLKGQESALVKLIEKQNEKRFQSEADLLSNIRNFSTGNLTLLEKVTEYFRLFNDPTNFLGLKGLNRDLADANAQTEFFSQELQGVREQLLTFDPLTTGLESYKKILDQITRDQNRSSKEAAKSEKERASIARGALEDLLNADKQLLQERIELLRTQIDAQKSLVSGLSKLDKDYLTEYSRLLALQEELDRASVATRIEDRSALSTAFRAVDQEYFNRFVNAQRDVNAKIAAERQKGLKQDEKDRLQAINNIIKGAEAGIDRVIADQQRLSQEYINSLRDIVEPAVNIFSRTLAPAIDSVFNAILNGQDAIKALGQSFKQLVIDLTATVIKAAALAALVSIISGGKIPFGATFRAGLSSRGIGDFLGNLLPSAGFGLNAAPINGPGGFALSGQVVFVQRGADLVGVLNQTSARIGRVG